MSNAWRAGRTLLWLVSPVWLSGCISVTNNPGYPAQWPPLAYEQLGECPLIAGRYLNLGEQSLLAGVDCSLPEKLPVPGDASVCTPWLAPNLGLWREAQTVRLSQPSEDMLQVALDDAASGPRVHTYRRGQDFRCDADGLHFEQAQSALRSTGATVAGALLLSGGWERTRRSFRRDREGALVMTLHKDVVASLMLIGGKRSATSHVRWQPATEARQP